MKHICVTPAGRRRYLEILHKHIAHQQHKGYVDEWHLWVNTKEQEDLDFCNKLAEEYPEWIKAIHLPDNDQTGTSWNIHRFFKYSVDPDTVYTRLDDDVVWLQEDYFKRIYEYRVAHPEFFLVYGNIVNNALIAHLQQKRGVIDKSKGVCAYDVFDPVGWQCPKFAEAIQRWFLKDLQEGKLSKWHMDPVVLKRYERMSINGISWLGSEFAAFEGCVGLDEESWLASEKPKALKKPNAMCGDAMCIHFSFFTQRAHLDTTDLMDIYRTLAPALP